MGDPHCITKAVRFGFDPHFPVADGFGCRVHKRGATPFIRITKDRQLGCDLHFPVADGFGCRVHKRGATM